MTPQSISVIVPTYNMAGFLQPLWDSFGRSGLTDACESVLFVNDASTDNTLAALESLCRSPDPRAAKIRILNLEKNQGRFLARFEGAKAASSSRLLFLDSRLVLPDHFGASLLEVAKDQRQIVGSVDIDTSRSVFCLYWDRSHRAIFRRHYRDAAHPIVLTPANYDGYLKGTTVFLCSRELFLKTCRLFEKTPLLNDDTYMMKEMVQEAPIVIHPDLRISWVPRETALDFLKRLWERGPSFVEYHVFERRGKFFWVVLLGVIALIAWLGLASVNWQAAAYVALGFIGAVALSTVFFSRSLSDFLRMGPLHTAVVFTFGTAILRGIWINGIRALSHSEHSGAQK